jgi:hypothetical protein
VVKRLIRRRILVGVTGHRTLVDQERVAGCVRKTLDQIRRTESVAGPVVLDLVSSLAEGADRLVAEVVLESPDARLEVVLPLRRRRYETDFKSGASRKAFDRLLSRASSVTEGPETADRPIAYERAARLVVDRADVLIAIWDGKPAAGRGGTAEIVEYARATGCAVFVIAPDGRETTAPRVREVPPKRRRQAGG